jgi:hypothetical protein
MTETLKYCLMVAVLLLLPWMAQAGEKPIWPCTECKLEHSIIIGAEPLPESRKIVKDQPNTIEFHVDKLDPGESINIPVTIGGSGITTDASGGLRVSMCRDQVEKMLNKLEPYLSHRTGKRTIIEYGSIMSEREWEDYQRVRKECAR